MEEQGLPGESAVEEDCEKGASGSLAERWERLREMDLKVCVYSIGVQKEIQGMREMLKVVEREQASWRRERESMESELCKLKSEVEQLRAALAESGAAQVCDLDRGSEEIDLKAVAEHRWLEGRQVLAPITPEAVRDRTLVSKHGSCGKENVRSVGEENQRLRLENERLREKTSKLSKEYKGLRSQYNYLWSKDRSASKGDVRQLISNRDELQAALETGLEKPSRIRRRSSVEAEAEGGGGTSPRLSFSNTKFAPSTPVLPQTVAGIATGPTASTSGITAKAEPAHLESAKEFPQIPPTKDNTAGGSDAGLERIPVRPTDGFVPTAMASNRKRTLESLGKPPAKSPAFKFVEPVRKKADRENLQATECKLCKRFYDAVSRGDANGAAESRCIHVDKSRHRFRDLPPATPEGFWNIGFDSDF